MIDLAIYYVLIGAGVVVAQLENALESDAQHDPDWVVTSLSLFALGIMWPAMVWQLMRSCINR